MKTLSVLLPCVIHLTNDHLCRALPFSLLIFSNKLLNKWWSCRSLDTTTLMWRLWTETGIFQMSYVLLNRLCKYIQLIWGSNRTFKLNRILNWLNFIEMGSFWSVSLYIYIYTISRQTSLMQRLLTRSTEAFTWWRHQNGNILRVTGPLWGESNVTGGFPSQRPVTWSFDVFFDFRLNKRLNKNRDAGDLKRHRAHYDVTVM